MHVVLVNPEGSMTWQEKNKKGQYMFPYSLVFLQNYLNKYNIKSKIFDLFFDHPDSLIDYCKNIKEPLLLGVTAQSYNRDNAIEAIRKIKEIIPGVFVVVGGKHFTYCADQTLQMIPEIDVVVRGEGEITFYELINTLKNNGSYEDILGISYRKDGSVVNNDERPLEKDINKFSLDYENLNKDEYSRGVFLRNYENEGIKSLPVILGRGCSQKCIFCVYRQMKYRVRTLDSVMEEIRYLKKNFNAEYFTFSDPSFTERREFAKAFCEQILSENLNIKWYCEARVDTPIELLELMAKAGCVSLDFAIESGSPKVLKAIRKNIDIPMAMEFAGNCKKLGIRTLVFFMVSLPEETVEDTKMTKELIKSFYAYSKYLAIGTTTILPGTDLEIVAREKGILPSDFNWYDKRFYHNNPDLAPVNVPLYIENLSVEYIRKFIEDIRNIRFAKYYTGADFIRTMRTGMRRIPNQPLSQTLKDTIRFSKGVANKLFKG